MVTTLTTDSAMRRCTGLNTCYLFVGNGPRRPFTEYKQWVGNLRSRAPTKRPK